jgi:hypothetical protein
MEYSTPVPVLMVYADGQPCRSRVQSRGKRLGVHAAENGAVVPIGSPGLPLGEHDQAPFSMRCSSHGQDAYRPGRAAAPGGHKGEGDTCAPVKTFEPSQLL